MPIRPTAPSATFKSRNGSGCRGIVWAGLGAVASRGLVQCRRPPCGSFPLVHSSQSQAGADGREETGKRRRPG